MTLEYLVENIYTIDEEMVIFQKEELSFDSEVVLFDREDDRTVRVRDGIKYVYFLETFMAKELIEDTIAASVVKPNIKELALRLLHYAKFDA